MWRVWFAQNSLDRSIQPIRFQKGPILFDDDMKYDVFSDDLTFDFPIQTPIYISPVPKKELYSNNPNRAFRCCIQALNPIIHGLCSFYTNQASEPKKELYSNDLRIVTCCCTQALNPIIHGLCSFYTNQASEPKKELYSNNPNIAFCYSPKALNPFIHGLCSFYTNQASEPKKKLYSNGPYKLCCCVPARIPIRGMSSFFTNQASDTFEEFEPFFGPKYATLDDPLPVRRFTIPKLK